ncbi:MAG: hypothetical protein RL593_664 [Pseudomonadota bacterium]|jgi:hypothetical protein
MKSRWLVNLFLLVLVVGIASVLYLRPKEAVIVAKDFEVSTLKLGAIKNISIEFPAKASVAFEKIDGYWYIQKPLKTRADQMVVQKVLSIIAAKSTQRFSADDLSRFGLDQPKLKLKLDSEEFLFGTFNPVTAEQYVAYNHFVYLLPVSYSEYAETQISEFIDKSPFKPKEKIAGFNFSNLEQWESSRLNVDLVDGQWKVSLEKAKPNQKEMAEWFDAYWRFMSVQRVEPYTPDRKATFPSFEVKLVDGSKVHFDKLQESPELLLGRPDEGMMYHVPADIGFALLNPPINLGK